MVFSYKGIKRDIMRYIDNIARNLISAEKRYFLAKYNMNKVKQLHSFSFHEPRGWIFFNSATGHFYLINNCNF